MADKFGKAFSEQVGFGFEFVTVLQGSVNNNHSYKRVPGYPTKHDRLKLQSTADVSLKALLWKDATAFVRYEVVEDRGISRQAGGLTGANDNAKGYEDKLAEFWIEQSLFGESLVLTLGKLDPFASFDTNAAANDERGKFLSNQFVNSLTIDSPDYAYGARIGYQPLAWLVFNAGVFEDGHGYTNIAKDRLAIAEVGFMPQFFGLDGTYRSTIWHNSTDHEKLMNPARNSESGSGYGLNFDQYFSEGVCVFARWGVQSSGIYELRQAWSVGFSVAGRPWNRTSDTFAMAYGRGGLSDAYRDWQRGDGVSPADEGRMEAYYSFYINEHFAIGPDIQVVHNLTGASKANTVTIFGLRLQCML